MFYHKNLALQGLYPGLISNMSVANLGHYETEVIIEPVKPSGGGGWVPTRKGEKPDRYRVTVRVKINGKLYEETYIVDDTRAKVIAEMHGIKPLSQDTPMVSVNGIQIIDEETIQIKVKSVKTTKH